MNIIYSYVFDESATIIRRGEDHSMKVSYTTIHEGDVKVGEYEKEYIHSVPVEDSKLLNKEYQEKGKETMLFFTNVTSSVLNESYLDIPQSIDKVTVKGKTELVYNY